jgi:transposase-like protein
MARYTEAEKGEAVAHCLQHGMKDAHDTLGIPKPTLSSWMTEDERAEMAERFTSKTSAATAAAAQTWADRRPGLTDQLGEIAQLAMDKAVELIRLGKTADAQKAMVTAAIGIDKAQLLSGHATSRTETIAPDRNPEYEEALDRTIRLVQDKAS